MKQTNHPSLEVQDKKTKHIKAQSLVEWQEATTLCYVKRGQRKGTQSET